MSSALGRLVAAIALDTAEFTVGTDKAKYQAAQLASEVDKSLKGLESKVKGTMGSIGAAIAGGFAISALKSQFDAYAEGATKIGELASKAGVSVEQMSALANTAKLSGTSADDMAAAMEKLSRGIAGTNAATSTQTKALDFLGISTRDSSGHIKDAGTITQEAALKLAAMADGATKTALLMDLYGKAGANVLPVLKDLAEFGVQNATVTAQQAAAAKEYEQDLVRLGMAKSALVTIISSELLPVGDAVVKTFLQMSTQTGGVRDEAQKLAQDGSIRSFAMSAVNLIGLVMNAGDGVVRTFEGIGEEIAYMVARTVNSVAAMGKAAYALATGDFMASVDAVTEGSAKDADIVAQHTQALQDVFKTPLAGDVFVSKVATNLAAIDAQMKAHSNTVKKVAGDYGAMGDAAVLALVKIGKAQADANAAVAQSAAKTVLAQDAAALHDLDTAYKLGGVSIADYYSQKATLEQKDIDAQVNAETIAYRGFAQELSVLESLSVKGKAKAAVDAQIATVQKQMAEEADKVNGTLATQSKVTDTLTEGQIALTNANLAILKPLGDENTKLKEQIDTFGLTTQQVILYNKAKLQAQLIAIQNIPEYDAEDEAIKRQVATLTSQINLLDQIANKQGVVDSLTQQKQIWTDLSAAAGNFFGDLVVNGKSAFDNLKSSLKSFAQQLIAFFAQRFVLQMVAGASGSIGATTAQAGANAALGGVNNSLIGSAVTGASSYLFGTAADAGLILDSGGTAGLATSGVIGAGGFAATIGTAAAGAAEGLGVAGASAAAFGEAVAAAVPVIGWIVAIGLVLYSVFGSKGGAPKGGGSFMGSFDPTGKLIGNPSVQGTDNGRFFTPNQSDSQLAVAGTGVAASYFGELARLGGKAPGNVGFGLGFDTDPGGTAANRISSAVTINGQQVFSSRDRDIGRDQSQIQPEMQLEASRMILAALQGSQLPQYLANVFKGVDALAADQTTINNLLATADALKGVYDITQRNPIKDLAQGMADALNPFSAAIRNNETALKSAMVAWDGSLTTTQNLQQATVSYYNAQLQLMAGIEQAKQSIDDLFGNSVRNYTLAGLGNQGKYDFYQKDAASLQAQALASSDPETIKNLASRIDADMNAAFNLLTPDQQAGPEGQAFISRAQSTDKALDDRLAAIEKATQDVTTSMLAELKTYIGASDAAQTAAANTQQNAANTNLTAAQTTRTVIVQGADGSQQVVTFSG